MIFGYIKMALNNTELMTMLENSMAQFRDLDPNPLN
jgi:hypothetical protein